MSAIWYAPRVAGDSGAQPVETMSKRRLLFLLKYSRYQWKGQWIQCHAVCHRNVFPQPCMTFTPPRVISIQRRGTGECATLWKMQNKMVNENAAVLLGRALHCNNSVKLTLSKTSLGKVNNPQQIQSLDQSITALLDCCKWISNVLAVESCAWLVYCWALLIQLQRTLRVLVWRNLLCSGSHCTYQCMSMTERPRLTSLRGREQLASYYQATRAATLSRQHILSSFP